MDWKIGEMKDKYFYEIIEELYFGDVLVMNNIWVLFVCLYGEKLDIGVYLEVFFLMNIEGDMWEILIKFVKCVKVGIRIFFGDGRL